MGFDITSDYDGKKVRQGMIIIYRVSPLFNIPTDWVNEITHVKSPGFLWIIKSQDRLNYGITSITLEKLMVVLKCGTL